MSWLQLIVDCRHHGGGDMQIHCKVRKCSDMIWFIAQCKGDSRCSALISFRHLDTVDCRYQYHGRRVQQGGRGSPVEGHWCWEHRKHKRLVQGRGGFVRRIFWNFFRDVSDPGYYWAIKSLWPCKIWKTKEFRKWAQSLHLFLQVKSAYAAFSQGHVDGKMDRDDFRRVHCTIMKVMKLENHGFD